MAKYFLGFHGTKQDLGKIILTTRQFKFSRDDEEWLGPGIYFFEDDIKQAENFCAKARKYNTWMIIKSDIEADIIIDLIKKDDFDEFEKIAHKIKDRCKKRKDGKPRTLMNNVILNVMYEAKPYDLVRAVFPVPKTNCADRTNVSPHQIQLCIRNHNCIKSIEEAC